MDRSQPIQPVSLTRRAFLKGSAAGAAAIGVTGSAPLIAGSGFLGSNDRIGVGFIGVGGRGGSHIGTVLQLVKEGRKIRPVAVCDAYGPRLRAAADRTGGKPYRDHRELLQDPAVDVVLIATPDRLHIPQALDAIGAGKDVYCEKPMGHWTQFDGARELYRETRRLERVVQIGNQANSSTFWQKVGEVIKAGVIGRPQLVEAGFYRLGDWGERMPIPDPAARPGPDLNWEAFLGDAPAVDFSVERFFSWRMFMDYAGGPCTDLFPHVLTPFVSLLGLGFPSLVSSSGGIFKYDDYGREVPDTFNMCIDYPQRLSLVLVCTLANSFQSHPVIRGDEGSIVFENVDWGRGCDSVKVVPLDRNSAPQTITGEQPDSTRAHWINFLDCVVSREKPVSDVEFGFHVQAALCMGMVGFLHQKTVRFDTGKQEMLM